MDAEINTDNTSDVLSHSHKIVDSILDTLEKWVKEEQELKVDNGEEIDNGFESDGNNDEVKAYIFDENGNLKAEVEVAEVESVLQNFREEEMMNEGGRNSNEVKESSSCVNVPQMVEGDDILMNSNIAQGRSCSEVEDSLADVQQTKVEKVVRCFDLKLVDRLEKAAKIIEHDEPQDVNVNVIATDQNYFSWKNIERDLLDEVCELMFNQEPHNIIPSMIDFPVLSQSTLDEKKAQARANIRKRALDRKKRHDARASPTSFKIGELVLVKTKEKSKKISAETKKFMHVYHGPFRIVSKPHANAYRLEYPKSKRELGLRNIVDLKEFKINSN
ncbi:uncharacterized protein LOC126297850 [Schistocerca gregaria]|uniref:uncharacterized protein LOC126297850 n=1 Tax=Schistocerca gregaria TaxID=7010 RepID=UPI00211EABE2|nr:uncharacterized protein LOC126297850 [Schistocerca gregaria]